jgi:hypothetical protein
MAGLSRLKKTISADGFSCVPEVEKQVPAQKVPDWQLERWSRSSSGCGGDSVFRWMRSRRLRGSRGRAGGSLNSATSAVPCHHDSAGGMRRDAPHVSDLKFQAEETRKRKAET